MPTLNLWQLSRVQPKLTGIPAQTNVCIRRERGFTKVKWILIDRA